MASPANSAALSEKPAYFSWWLTVTSVKDKDFQVWDKWTEIGAMTEDPTDTAEP